MPMRVWMILSSNFINQGPLRSSHASNLRSYSDSVFLSKSLVNLDGIHDPVHREEALILEHAGVLARNERPHEIAEQRARDVFLLVGPVLHEHQRALANLEHRQPGSLIRDDFVPDEFEVADVRVPDGPGMNERLEHQAKIPVRLGRRQVNLEVLARHHGILVTGILGRNVALFDAAVFPQRVILFIEKILHSPPLKRLASYPFGQKLRINSSPSRNGSKVLGRLLACWARRSQTAWRNQ